MNYVVSLYTAFLFFLLTPAILLRLPPNGSKYVVALVHAVVFAVIFHFTKGLVWELSATFEAETEYPLTKNRNVV
jgi:hypothetical protein